MQTRIKCERIRSVCGDDQVRSVKSRKADVDDGYDYGEGRSTYGIQGVGGKCSLTIVCSRFPHLRE
jgi:hypothetical protein